MLLSALYKANGEVAVGSEAVRTEVREQEERINGPKECFPSVAAAMMYEMRPPKELPAGRDWVEEVCTWERFESALKRAGADTGVGKGGFAGYLIRKAPEEVQRLYYETICGILRGREYPPTWKSWIALLAMKKNEDPRDLSRRRDLWLMPHSLKVAARMMTGEFERASHEGVPASQAGFRRMEQILWGATTTRADERRGDENTWATTRGMRGACDRSAVSSRLRRVSA